MSVVGLGIDTSYPQIDDDGTVHVDPYISVDLDLKNIYFLGQRYVPKESAND